MQTRYGTASLSVRATVASYSACLAKWQGVAVSGSRSGLFRAGLEFGGLKYVVYVRTYVCR